MMKNLFLFTLFIVLNLSQLEGLPSLSEENNRSDDTIRIDPLDSFHKYRGGYDITNKNYWSSTAFTGISGYAIAVLWILCGLGYGGFLLIITTCCKSSRKIKKRSAPCHNQCYVQPLLLASFFTLLAVIACGLVLGGDAKFHSRAKKVIDIIIDTADDASKTIYTTTGAMKEMSNSLQQVKGSSRETEFLKSTSNSLDKQAADIERQASKNRRLIDKGLKIVYIVTTLIVSLTLIATIALLVSGILKFPRILQVLLTLCWILTTFCWLFFGIYFFLQNFAGDTCTALESFQKDPYNNSLSSILPCDELLSAKSVINDISAGIYDIVNEVNKNISKSYGNIIHICNPFSPPPLHKYEPWNCAPTSIPIGRTSQVLRMLTCPDSEGKTCNGGILISANYYNTVVAYTTSIQKLLDVYPGMESLVECQTVKDAFSEILQKHCKPLKRYAHMLWASLVFLSVVMVALVLVWTIRSRHEKKHHYLGGSIKPHNKMPEEILESGTDEPENNELKPV